MTGNEFGFALVLLGLLLGLGKWIRVKSKTSQKLFLPTSIIAGGIALLLGPGVFGRLAEGLGFDGFVEGGLFTEPIMEVWSTLPGLLISVVFAALFLGERIPKVKEAVSLAGPQLSLGIAMGAGQYVVGIILALTILGPIFGLPPLVGALIEVGFEGGHGTAAGLGETFADLGFPEGQDLALGLATVGVVSGVVIGIALINWGVRTGRTVVVEEAAAMSLAEQRGVFEREDQRAAAWMTTRPASVEPLAIHFAVVSLAIVIGRALLWALQELEQLLWADAVEVFAFVPLFPLAMVGGVIVQKVIDRLDRQGLVDREMMLRIQGFALDLLIVSALATLSLQVIAENFVPFVLLALGGILWNVSAFIVLARRMIPEFWFERGIGDLGQSLGVTATGLILMKVADPETKTPAYEAFGYKQLAFEPFFGGGLITAASIPIIAQFGPFPMLTVMVLVTGAAIAIGVLRFGRRPPDPDVIARARPGYGTERQA